jgi:hypothetical protein
MGKTATSEEPTQKQKVVVNDSVRKDGGKPTDDQPVPAEQIKKIEEKAVNHTADETGS